MTTAENLLRTLRTWHKLPAKHLLERLGISRATLMRAVQALGPQIVARGRARRTAYAARRAVRGSLQALPLYRIDQDGQPHEVALLHPIYPEGCAADFLEPLDWPLDDNMQDGWFEGLPYPLDDMRPQGFLGRHFARHHADLLQVSTDPKTWSEDDTLHALTLLGSDQPGNYVLGETALRQWLTLSQQDTAPLDESQVASAYLLKAEEAMTHGTAGSSAGGEFPKFTAFREIAGKPTHVIVKFSGSDDAPGTVRWSDLLVCEHLALCAAAEHLGVEAAVSRIYQAGGRTFLEVDRFDRHGRLGRSPLCSWAALNAALFGLAGKPWPEGGAALFKQGLIDAICLDAMQRLWLFGQLIANTDMHDGNLSFRPGLQLAPVYDMLPMGYSPVRGVELPVKKFAPPLPLPAERNAWLTAARTAEHFWTAASGDARISHDFRAICTQNASKIHNLMGSRSGVDDPNTRSSNNI
ncbi:MAG: type II toxin-antitoxin system HipA family toxin YjjJ [Pseudomonadota bacterium]